MNVSYNQCSQVTYWNSLRTQLTATTIPDTDWPQSMPTTGTLKNDGVSFRWKVLDPARTSSFLPNRIGAQNGVTDIANLVPMIEIGIVEPSIAINTAGNFF